MTNSRSRIAGCFILGALCVPALPTMAGARLSVEVDEPECKILQAADKDGDLEIAIKVSVQNTSESEAEVKAIVQGIDRKGFEVFELRLSDAIKAGQTRVLTDSDFLQERRYKTIVRWRVEEVTVRPGQPGSAAQPTPDAPR